MIKDKVNQHVKQRTVELKELTLDLHKNAPRGGSNFNRFGEARSAPGEQPAQETNRLFANIDQSVTPISNGFSVMVNWKLLEFGGRKLRPRPLGRISLSIFKART